MKLKLPIRTGRPQGWRQLVMWLPVLGALTCLLPVQAGPVVLFRTAVGSFEVELFEDKPVTVKNFLNYVTSGRYTNMFFHRLVPGFVIQGGGFFTEDRGSNDPILAPVPTDPTITNEFNIGVRRSNTYGTLAMAKLGGDPNSASSQWFINLGDNSANLDAQNGGFTVFARVLSTPNSTNVLNALNRLQRVSLDPTTPFTDLPVLRSQPSYEDLVYVEIAPLAMKVQALATNILEISWNSASNRVHDLEFSPVLPTPTWQLLASTNGNGSRLRILDDPDGAPARFYRVRIRE